MDVEHPTLPYPGPPAGDDPEPPAPADGRTWIADSIVAKVAASAAREVDGVDTLRGGIPRRGFIRGSERRRGGAMVQVRDGTVDVSRAPGGAARGTRSRASSRRCASGSWSGSTSRPG